MTKLISHRGNLSGPNKDLENHPDYIRSAFKRGYEVEVDVWFENNQFLLGHDKPQYEVTSAWLLQNSFLWIHAKNIVALNELLDLEVVNCFYHQNDDCTLTSFGYIWTYPGKQLFYNSIAVLPEIVPNWDLVNAAGICSDYIERYEG